MFKLWFANSTLVSTHPEQSSMDETMPLLPGLIQSVTFITVWVLKQSPSQMVTQMQAKTCGSPLQSIVFQSTTSLQ